MPWWTALAVAEVVNEAAVGLVQNRERLRKWRAARQAADARGKPLLVVGAPIANRCWPFTHSRLLRSLLPPHHPEGDVTLDLDPMVVEQCPATGVVGDVRAIPFPDGYFGASLSSHVLEHLSSLGECIQALEELHRVTDGPVFVASPIKRSVIAHLVPDHYLWVEQKNGTVAIEDRRTGEKRNWRPL